VYPYAIESIFNTAFHRLISGTPFANMEETYQYFKALILKHSLSVSVFVHQSGF
jgi:hypothetical protein